MTLVEIVIAMALCSLLMVTLCALYLYSTRTFLVMENLIDLDNASRLAVDRLSQEVRQADRLLSYSTNELVFERHGHQIRFTYYPQYRTLVRHEGTEREVLLSDCDSLQCEIFQRTPSEGAYGFFPTANPTDCKVVRLTWMTSRSVGDLVHNQANLRSAQIVLRNQKL